MFLFCTGLFPVQYFPSKCTGIFPLLLDNERQMQECGTLDNPAHISTLPGQTAQSIEMLTFNSFGQNTAGSI